MRDPEALLEIALSHWRRNPDPELGEAIEALGTWCARNREPVAPTRSSMGLSEAWHVRSALLDPADLDLLLEPLTKTHMGSPAGKVRDLAEWPLDPRICRRLAALFEHNRWTGQVQRGVRMAILQVLQRYTHVPTASRNLHRWTTAGRSRSKPYGRWVHTELVAMGSTHPIAVPEDREANRLSKACRTQAEVPEPTPPAVLSDLWKVVWADLDDLTPRAILGDALQAAGDARGEFIQLQLMGKARTSTRERLLLKTWEREWLETLEPYVSRAGNVWRNGLLERVSIGRRVPDLELSLLAGIHHVHTGAEGSIQELLRAERLPGLERITGLQGFMGDQLGHPGVVHIGALRWASLDGLDDWMGTLHERFPALRSLSLRWSAVIDPDRAVAMSHTMAFAKLKSIEFAGRNMPEILSRLGAYQQILSNGPDTVGLVPRHGVDDERTVGWRVELARDRTLTFILGGIRKLGLSPTEQLETYLLQVPLEVVDRIIVIAPKRASLDLASLSGLTWPVEIREE